MSKPDFTRTELFFFVARELIVRTWPTIVFLVLAATAVVYGILYYLGCWPS